MLRLGVAVQRGARVQPAQREHLGLGLMLGLGSVLRTGLGLGLRTGCTGRGVASIRVLRLWSGLGLVTAQREHQQRALLRQAALPRAVRRARRARRHARHFLLGRVRRDDCERRITAAVGLGGGGRQRLQQRPERVGDLVRVRVRVRVRIRVRAGVRAGVRVRVRV